MNLDLSKEYKQTSLPPKRHYIAIVLDRSGSMGSILDATINGFNAQIDAINRESTPETFVSLVTFGSSVTPIYFNRNNGSIERLGRHNYQPEGWTALYDAVGYTIKRLENSVEYANDATFLVMIVSDGYENRSTDYNAFSISNLIRNKQATGRWTFTYLGSNQDLAQVSQILNIPFANMMSFTSTPIGTARGFTAHNAAVSNYMSAVKLGATSSDSFYSSPNSSADSLIPNDVILTSTVDPDPPVKV